jgi:hypothetical protein
VAVVVAGVSIWTGSRHDSTQPVTGTGPAACRQLLHDQHGGRYVDSRVVNGTTAATWLAQVAPDIDPAPYRDDDHVTVCLLSGSPVYATYVVGGSGQDDRVTSGGLEGPGGAGEAMAALDRLTTGGRPTTDRPFTCSGPRTEHDPDVTPSLPAGATAARICYGSEFFTPSQVLTQNVDTLVRAVNAAPMVYSPPDFNCSGAEGDYGFTIVFQYSSGTRTVSEETCRGLAVGRFTREGRVSLDPLYRSLLAEQIGTAAGSVLTPPCPKILGDRPQGVGDLREIVAARYCPTRAGGAGPVLTAGQLRQLRAWGRSYLGAATEPDDPTGRCSTPATGWPRLSVADAWGDYFTVLLQGCGRRMFGGVVNWAAKDKVLYPFGEFPTIARLARQLALESP